MSRRIEAVLDNVQLRDIGPVLISQVREPPAEMEITYGARPGRSGQDVLSCRRRLLRVSIDVQIKELFDLALRTSAQQAIAGWARGSILELSNHPGQQLHVKCRNYPVLGDVRDYTSELTIDLEADEIPFWEEKVPVNGSGSGASGTIQMFIPGTAEEIPVDTVFTPSGTLTTLTVTAECGGISKSITLNGISISGAVQLTHDARGRLEITSGNISLLPYRTADSADDLLIPAGAATITWSANVSGSMQLTARGRWL